MLIPVLLLSSGFLQQSAAQPHQEVAELLPGVMQERKTISPGETHQYSIHAKAGDRIEGLASQYGVDIELRLWAPDRKKSKKFDFHVDGVEPFRHRTSATGNYLLEVKSLSDTQGDYGLYLGLCEQKAVQWPDLAAQFLQQVPPNHPGMAVGIIENGKSIFLGTRGLIGFEPEQKLELSSPFHLRELSFAVYAHAFLELEARGELDLKTPISELLPWFPKYPDSFTIKDLISIRTGLPNCIPLLEWSADEPKVHFSRNEIMECLSMRQDIRSPGEWRPDGTFTDEFLIQEALVAASGLSLHAAMDSLVFRPLGMTNSGVVEFEQYPRLADRLIGLEKNGWEATNPNMDSAYFLSTTAQDLSTWFLFFTNDKSDSHDFWARLRDWQLIRNWYSDRELYYKVLPAYDVIVFEKTMSQQGFFPNNGGRIDEALFEDWPLTHPGRNFRLKRGRNHLMDNPRLEDMLPYCGTYQCDQANLLVTIAIEDGELILTDGKKVELALEVAKNRIKLYGKQYSRLSSLLFAELEGESHSQFRAIFHDDGRAMFRRIE